MQYWDKSVTLVEGCTLVSEGCLNCWSAEGSYRRQFHSNQKIANANIGLTMKPIGKSPIYSGVIRTREDRLPELLKGRKPQVIQIWNDLFHGKVHQSFQCHVYDTMSRGKHTYLILTKRARLLYDFIFRNRTHDVGELIKDNIWHGVTTENQHCANERIPDLLRIPGKRWLSVEPLLGDIDLSMALEPFHTYDPLLNRNPSSIHQVIVGCETGRNARPCKVEWIESVVDQCSSAGVPVYVKAVNINGKITSDITKFPETLRVRELAWKGGEGKWISHR